MGAVGAKKSKEEASMGEQRKSFATKLSKPSKTKQEKQQKQFNSSTPTSISQPLPSLNFNLCVVGGKSSGKSNLIRVFAYNYFTEAYYPTLGTDLIMSTIQIEDRAVNLAICDTGNFFFLD